MERLELHQDPSLVPAAPPGDGPVWDALSELGCHDLRALAVRIARLPYGRLFRPGELVAPLLQHRGTCSSRHALLAAAAREAGVPALLHLVLFPMSAATHPAVGGVLSAAGLQAVPEAHCVVQIGTRWFDLTFPGSSGITHLEVWERRTIEPSVLYRVKPTWHRERVEIWARARRLDPDAVWRARELAIAALGASHALAVGPSPLLEAASPWLTAHGFCVSLRATGRPPGGAPAALLDDVRRAIEQRGPVSLALLWIDEETLTDVADLLAKGPAAPRLVVVHGPERAAIERLDERADLRVDAVPRFTGSQLDLARRVLDVVATGRNPDAS